MNQKYFLVAYIFKIPFKFQIWPFDHDYNDFLELSNVNIQSNLNYINEEGNLRFQDSKNKILKRGIVVGTPKNNYTELPRITFLNSKSEFVLENSFENYVKFQDSNKTESNIVNIFNELPKVDDKNSESLNSTNLKDEKLLKEKNQINMIQNLSMTSGDNINLNQTTNNKFKDDENEIYFIISKFNFYFLKYFANLNDNFELKIYFSEARDAPFILQIILHIPLLITSILVVIIIITFDTEIDKDKIKQEIEKIPIKKFDENMEFNECSICLDRFLKGSEVKILNCNHCFHRNCIDSWLLNLLKCPLCRAPVGKLAETSRYQMYQTLNNV